MKTWGILLMVVSSVGSLAWGGEWPVSDRWRLRPIHARDFYVECPLVRLESEVITKQGPRRFDESPCWANAVIRVKYEDMADPTSSIYRKLLHEKTNPVSLSCRGFKDWDLKVIDRIRKDFGNRFIGVTAYEWVSWRFCYAEGDETRVAESRKALADACRTYGMPLPRNRDESFEFFRRIFQDYYGRYLDAKIPLYLGNATFFDHWQSRLGVSITGVELGGHMECSPIQLAVTRGASRQFNVPWGVLLASFYPGYNHFDSDISYKVDRPDMRYVGSGRGFQYGPHCGTSLSLQKRLLYAATMAGANLVTKESEQFIGWYDEEIQAPATQPADPKNRKNYLSPLGKLYEEFYDTVILKHDRGVTYTPVAIVLDRNHGNVLQYDVNHTFGHVPYGEGDYQVRALINKLFPWEDYPATWNRERMAATNGPFGDIFDVVTSDAPREVLDAYRVLILAGDVRLDSTGESNLEAFVRGGGTVLMTTEQMTPGLWRLSGLADGGKYVKAGANQAMVHRPDGWKIPGLEPAFEYRRVKLISAEPLVVLEGDPSGVLAARNHLGKGQVVVATPKWMVVPGSKNRLLGLFDCLLRDLVDDLLPVKVYGDIQWMLNRNAAGWVVTLINNKGVYKYGGLPPVVRAEESAPVVLVPRFAWSTAREWLTGQVPAQPSVLVPPGEVRIVEWLTEPGKKLQKLRKRSMDTIKGHDII